MQQRLTAYISLSTNKRKLLAPVVSVISDALAGFNLEPLVFTDRYLFTPIQEQEMMHQALKDIDGCSLFISETSDKGITTGVEVGYAKAKGKPVIYLRHQSAEHTDSVFGISDFQIIYANGTDLKNKLTEVLSKIYSPPDTVQQG